MPGEEIKTVDDDANLRNLGHFAYRKRNFRECVNLLNKINVPLQEDYRVIGYCYLKMDNLLSAISNFSKSLSIDFHHFDIIGLAWSIAQFSQVRDGIGVIVKYLPSNVDQLLVSKTNMDILITLADQLYRSRDALCISQDIYDRLFLIDPVKKYSERSVYVDEIRNGLFSFSAICSGFNDHKGLKPIVGLESFIQTPTFKSTPEENYYSLLVSTFNHTRIYPNLFIYHIFTEELLDAIIGKNKNPNFLFQSSVDFCVVNPKTMYPVFCVELDSSFHDDPKSQTYDEIKNTVFLQSSLPLFRFRPKRNIENHWIILETLYALIKQDLIEYII